MSSLMINLKLENSQTDLQSKFQLETGKPREQLLALQALINEIKAGSQRANVDVHTGSADPVAASNTITLATVLADDTIVIGGVTFTAKASPSGEEEFDQSGDDTADAASLASKINNHSTLSQIVSASAASGVVTVTALQKGVIGNFITLAETGGTMTIGGSGAALESGAGGATEAAVNYNMGLS